LLNRLLVLAALQNRRHSLFLLAAGLLAFALTASAAAPAYRLLGQSAPDFALKSAAGPNVRLSEYRGGVVALAFWGSHCGICGAQLASLSRMVETYKSAGLTGIAVDVDDNQAAAGEFAVTHAVSFPVLFDPAKSVAREYRIDNLPMLLLIDRAGNIRYFHRDYRSGHDAQYLDEIKILLDE
jgi:peroxiredoxin